MSELDYKKQKNCIIVYFESPLDISTSPLVEKNLEMLIELYPDCSFVLNLSRVAYINSAGLGVIILAAKKLEKAGKTLMLTNLNNVVKKVISILDAHEIVSIYDDEEDAVSSCNGEG